MKVVSQENLAYIIEKLKTADTLKTSVINNLTSTNITSALSAYQGKILNDGKVDKVSGKGLSTNDFTSAEKTKLAGIAEGANKITIDSALSSTSTNPVQNKILKDYIDTAISGRLATDGIAASAIKLAIPRTINGIAFDGTKDITITAEAIDNTKLPLTGGTLTGKLVVPELVNTGNWCWVTPNNFYLKPRNNNEEWSFDLGMDETGTATEHTGTHAQFWSGKNSSAIMALYNDDNSVHIPNGPLVLGRTLQLAHNTGIRGTCGGGTDYWGIVGGGSDDNGYCEIYTEDNGNEPIVVRQYNAGTLVRTAYLLDGAGNTSFPGHLDTVGHVYAAGRFYSDFASETWINGVSNAVLNGTYTGYGAILNMPTISGRVSLSTYPASDNCVYLGYASNSQISAGTNSFNNSIYWDGANNVLYTINQTISGTLFGNSGNGLIVQSNNTGSWKEGIRIYSASNGYSTMYCGNTGLTNGIALVAGANNSTHYIDVIHGGVTYTVSLKAQTGTVALTSDIPSSYDYVHSGAWNISSWNESSLMATSYAGSVYRTDIGSWWNMMNIRHRGGNSDGIYYGIQMVTSLTGADKLLEYRKNYGQNAWTNWVSICYSDDESVRNLYMNSISTWNSYYSGYPNGTIMFCWE